MLARSSEEELSLDRSLEKNRSSSLIWRETQEDEDDDENDEDEDNEDEKLFFPRLVPGIVLGIVLLGELECS